MSETTCAIWSSKRVPYNDAWRLQLNQVQKIISGQAGATIFFLEHLPVVTIGRRGKDEHLLYPEAALKEKGIECCRIDRGGDVTYHGPGQLVVYPMLPLAGPDRDIHLFLRNLEEVGLRILTDYGVTGSRIPGLTGVWVDEKKIMAVGVGVKKWVTFHGLAFNFANNLEGFDLIIPCGIIDKGVTSLHLLLSRDITRKEIEERFRFHFSEVFHLKLEEAVDPFNSEVS